jgi:hypothetical protein
MAFVELPVRVRQTRLEIPCPEGVLVGGALIGDGVPGPVLEVEEGVAPLGKGDKADRDGEAVGTQGPQRCSPGWDTGMKVVPKFLQEAAEEIEPEGKSGETLSPERNLRVSNPHAQECAGEEGRDAKVL